MRVMKNDSKNHFLGVFGLGHYSISCKAREGGLSIIIGEEVGCGMWGETHCK